MLEKNVPILHIQATFPNELDLDEPLNIIEWFWILKSLIPKMTRYGIFWLSETQNPQKLSMTSSRMIFCWLCFLFGCSRSKNGDLLNHSRFLHIYVDPGLRTSLFWPIWGFWLSETQNPQKPSMTSCRIIFLRFWSTFGCSKAKIGNLHNHFEFFTYPGASTSLIWSDMGSKTTG